MSSSHEQPFPLPEPGHRDWYAHEALRALPRIIGMVDTNPYSATYGCFDRSFWHYRTMDFPCGMSQEFVLPLALAATLEMPRNPFHGKDRVRELALAGIDFAAKSSHPDGTCDDYFPFERAMGALVFSLYAMTETCLVLGDQDPGRVEFLGRRARWLLSHNETGQLANHQAFAALALYNTYLLTGERRFEDGSRRFRDLTMSWRSPEGWFQEYEGADPGYHSCLVSFLAKLWQKSKDETLVAPLVQACEFAWWFQHPDGSYGGEYGSRNTYHFYPHGFEVMAPHSNHAGQIADSYLNKGLPRRSRHFNDDDRMAAHYVYDWMQAWRDYHPKRTGTAKLPDTPDVKWFPEARILVVRERSYQFVCNASKGGVYKITGEEGPVASDTGPIAELSDGRVIVTHIVDREHSSARFDPATNVLEVEGAFQERRVMLPSPLRMIIFRLLLLTVGRFHANLVRSMLQKRLITGKHRLPIRFHRRIELKKEGVHVDDRITGAKGFKFRRLSVGSDATSIYVANSNTFQDSRLIPWRHYPGEAERLGQEGELKLERTIAAPRVVLAKALLETAIVRKDDTAAERFQLGLDALLANTRPASQEERIGFQGAIDHFLDQSGLFTDMQVRDTGNPRCLLQVQCRTLFQMTGRAQVREALETIFRSEICPDGQGQFHLWEEGPYIVMDFCAQSSSGKEASAITGSLCVSTNASLSDSKLPLPKGMR